MPTLYVTDVGARLEREYGRLLVTLPDDTVLARVPLIHVSEVVLVGRSVGVTTPALHALLAQGTPLTFIGRTGHLLGRLTPPQARNVPLRRAQYLAAADPAFALALSRQLLTGKLKNSRTLARRLVRAHPTGAATDAAERLTRLDDALRRLPTATTPDALRGVEGSAAEAYFGLLRPLLNARLPFGPRSRRPPKDATNALLSFVYTLLTQAVFTACELSGLDPYCGFLHAEVYGRPALALDLVEEFRPIVADSVILHLINRRVVSPKDFEDSPEDGPRLTRPALRRVLKAFEHRLETTIVHPIAERPLSYRKVLEVQARQIRKAIEANEPTSYRPFLTR